MNNINIEVEPQYFRKFRELVEKRFDSVDKRFDSIDKKIDKIDERLDTVEEKLDSHTEMIGELMVKTTQIQIDLRDKASHEYTKTIDDRVAKLELKIA